MTSMAQPGISPDSENTLLGQLSLPCDMSDSYKAFLSHDEPSPKHVATTPLKSNATRCRTTDSYWPDSHFILSCSF